MVPLTGITPAVTVSPPFRARTDSPFELAPSLDRLERFPARLFPRRYITWCARRQRFAAMTGAAVLYREVCAS